MAHRGQRPYGPEAEVGDLRLRPEGLSSEGGGLVQWGRSVGVGGLVISGGGVEVSVSSSGPKGVLTGGVSATPGVGVSVAVGGVDVAAGLASAELFRTMGK